MENKKSASTRSKIPSSSPVLQRTSFRGLREVVKQKCIFSPLRGHSSKKKERFSSFRKFLLLRRPSSDFVLDFRFPLQFYITNEALENEMRHGNDLEVGKFGLLLARDQLFL